MNMNIGLCDTVIEKEVHDIAKDERLKHLFAEQDFEAEFTSDEYAIEAARLEKAKKLAIFGLRKFGTAAGMTYVNALGVQFISTIKGFRNTSSDITTRRGGALPSRRDTLEILDGLDEVLALFEDYVKDPTKISYAKVATIMKRIDIDIGKVGAGIEDWRVLTMKAVGVGFGICLFSKITAFTGIIGKIFSKLFFNGRLAKIFKGGFMLMGALYGDKVTLFRSSPLRLRGWKSNDDVIDSAERLLNVLDGVMDLATDIKNIKNLDISVFASDKQTDISETAKVLDALSSATLKLLRRLIYGFNGLQRPDDLLTK